MNMLSSLKALLFSSAATGAPGEGVMPGAAAAAPGAPDFAQLLNAASVGEGEGGEAQPLPPAADFTQPAVDQESVVPHGEPKGRALGRTGAMPLPPGLALGLIKHRAAEQAPAAQPQQPETAEGEGAEAVAIALSPVQLPEAVEEQTDAPMAEQPSALPRPKGDKAVATKPEKKPDLADAVPAPAAEGDQPVGDEKPVEDQVAHNIPAPALSEPPVAVVAVAAPVAPPPAETKAAKTDKKAEGVGNSKITPAAQPKIAKHAPEEPAAAVRPVPAAKSVRTAQGPASSTSQGAVEVAGDPAQPSVPAPVLNGKPVKAEAAALLQIVRDQIAARQSGGSAKVGEAVSAAAHARKEAPAAAPDPVMTAPIVGAEPSPPTAPSTTITAAPVTPPVGPTVDLSASLGAQVVDMGVSGQWIDGLARDVAGLSANGAQGRFQIHTDQLGAVQVDIRHGGEGAAVSLTVANEAAELALKQDSERLKIDAGLASVRIADVKIERAPVAEAARADSAGQQSHQQQSHQSAAQNQFGSANGNPNMGQPQGQQGRWQGRENNGLGPKSSGDPAVLNHAEARQDAGENRRTRYA